MTFDNESQFISALMEMNDDGYDELSWLKKNYKLFKTTLNWPIGLPYIMRGNLNSSSLRDKFYTLYSELLAKHPHKIDNVVCEIIFIE